jgi:hypothetical protein
MAGDGQKCVYIQLSITRDNVSKSFQVSCELHVRINMDINKILLYLHHNKLNKTKAAVECSNHCWLHRFIHQICK